MDLYLKIQAPFDESLKSEIQIHNLDACFWLKGEIMVVQLSDKERTKQACIQICISFTSWTNSE